MDKRKFLIVIKLIFLSEELQSSTIFMVEVNNKNFRLSIK